MMSLLTIRNFESGIVKQRQNDITEFDEKIISMYPKGMTVRDIHERSKDLYGVRFHPPPFPI
jgi:transposase-like protein